MPLLFRHAIPVTITCFGSCVMSSLVLINDLLMYCIHVSIESISYIPIDERPRNGQTGKTTKIAYSYVYHTVYISNNVIICYVVPFAIGSTKKIIKKERKLGLSNYLHMPLSIQPISFHLQLLYPFLFFVFFHFFLSELRHDDPLKMHNACDNRHFVSI